ncbi:MAG: ParB-like nuclease domain-containing protein [archaeon]|nr:ParB-like nuclease domain-containing protein [archaeon]
MPRKKTDIVQQCSSIFKQLENLSIDKKIETINKIRLELKEYSPFNKEPVDCVVWVHNNKVIANDYNPNSVAPPEMELLRVSINNDGYTQPIVSYPKPDNEFEVIDGFHRNRVGKECPDITKRIHNYLPLVIINKSQEGKNDRIASTIRHNRARGKHNVDSMTDIVVELKRRNWTNKRIGKELGMDDDEILRLCQMSGLQEMFSDDEFSNSWDIDIMTEDDIDFILDEENIEPDKAQKKDRILHTYDKWECHKAGFYESKPPEGLTPEDCEQKYVDLLTDKKLFRKTLSKVIKTWEKSCEHYLTNDSMNRIAWLGQASLCIAYGVPSKFRSGYNKLTKEQKEIADKIAFVYLNRWLVKNDYEKLDDEFLLNKPKADIY